MTDLAATRSIVIEAEAKPPIPITLVGKNYTITAPKAALALKMAVQAKTAGDDYSSMIDTLGEWIVMAFGKVEAAKINKRLDDAEDLLDITHITQLMEAVIEVGTPNPPTSPSG